MKFSVSAFLGTIGAGILLFSGSCVNTDVVEPGENSHQIVLKLESPSDALSRADSEYKLRYIAQLYTYAGNAWTKKERKEIIEGENNDQIVFQAAPDPSYAILVFADYIPQNYTPDANTGLYRDYFYDTTSQNGAKRMVMRTTPGVNDDNLSLEFFNNPYYDSFFGMEKFEKTPEEKIINMKLKRATAKVIMQEKTEATGNIECVVTNLRIYNQFDLHEEKNLASANQEKSGSIKISKEITENDNELFHFFTMADPFTEPQVVNATFTVSAEKADIPAFDIKNIPVKANHQTIVKGAFVPVAEVEPEPGDDPESNEGDIILNLSKEEGWDQTDSFSWTQEGLTE